MNIGRSKRIYRFFASERPRVENTREVGLTGLLSSLFGI